MDERIEKAFQTANFMATITNQRRIAFEEFEQNLIFYTNGSAFKASPVLIAFVKSIIDAGFTEDVVIIDTNNVPVKINDVLAFYKAVVTQYQRVTLEYFTTYSEIRSKRKIEDLVKL